MIESSLMTSELPTTQTSLETKRGKHMPLEKIR